MWKPQTNVARPASFRACIFSTGLSWSRPLNTEIPCKGGGVTVVFWKFFDAFEKSLEISTQIVTKNSVLVFAFAMFR